MSFESWLRRRGVDPMTEDLVEPPPERRVVRSRRPVVRVQAPAPQGSFLGVLGRLWIALTLLGLVLGDTWPDRTGAAAAIAHGMCSARPQPRACTPGGHPSDFIRDWLFR